MNNSFKDNVNYILELNEKELKRLSKLVNEVINNRIKDEELLSNLFDYLLSLLFIDESKLRVVYYKLVNYVNTFNTDLAEIYDEFYKQDFMEEKSLNQIKNR